MGYKVSSSAFKLLSVCCYHQWKKLSTNHICSLSDFFQERKDKYSQLPCTLLVFKVKYWIKIFDITKATEEKSVRKHE
jgi:hypothetical protein